MNRRIGTFKEFRDYTLAVARGERTVDPSEPMVWSERLGDSNTKTSAAADLEDFNFIQSVLREQIVEHVFVGEVLRQLWNLGVRDVEVLRSEFDAGGYDLVMTYHKIVRHIQLKSVMESGKAKRVNVSLKLMEKPAGCVIWIVVSPKLELTSYRWFGGKSPDDPLPDISKMKVAKHTRGTRLERPAHRVVPLGKFERLATMDAVLQRLFGLP